MKAVFASYRPVVYKWRYALTLKVNTICGGIPSDPDVAASWIKTRLGIEGDTAALTDAVAKTMAERQIPADLAAEEVAAMKHLNGFKKDRFGLYIEGRQLKAAIKEAVSVATAAGNVPMKGYGETKKWITKFVPEHIFVLEDTLYLTELVVDADGEPIFDTDGEYQFRHITRPTDTHQRFVQTRHGSGIQREEYVAEAYIHATIYTDYEWGAGVFEKIWVTGEQQGVGAARSQGYGRYEVVRWDLLEAHELEQTVQIQAGPGAVQLEAAAQAARAIEAKSTVISETDVDDDSFDGRPAKKAVKAAIKSVAKAGPRKVSPALSSMGTRPAAAE